MATVYDCIDKERDNSGTIRRLLLKQVDTGQTGWVAKDALKASMSQHKVQVRNLRIDDSGKLVDCKSSAPIQQQPQRREESRLNNEELLKYLKQLEESSKESDSKIIRILRELYMRQNEMGAKLDILLSSSSDSANPSQARLEGLADYLVKNVDKLSDITDKLSKLNTSIIQSNTKPAHDGKSKTESMIEREANGYPKPENPYELDRCESSFMIGRNSLASSNNIDEINQDLNRLYIDGEELDGAFKDNRLTMEIVDRLRVEIDRANLAYKYTREEFEYQLTTMVGMHTDLGLLSMVYGVVSDKVNDIPGFIGETVTGGTGVLSGVSLKKFGYAMKDLSLSIAGKLPGTDKISIQDKRQAIRFKKDKQLSTTQIQDIKKFTDSMWNNAGRFIMNDPEWEIKLFVIQFLTKQYTGKYQATSDKNLGIQSESGKQSTFLDTTLADKHSNKLTEVSLTKICDYILDGRISDKYYIEACNRFFISYFAAKKVMYSYGVYPFDKTSTKKINGVFLDLVKIACLMLNINQGTIDGILTEFGAPESEKRHSARMGKPNRYDWEPAKFTEVLGM